MFGGNARAFNSRADESLLSGPAGTGKTLANLLRVYHVCRKYPGARCLIVRKTRESLTETVLVTWERDILGPTHPVLTRRPVIRRVRQSYTMLGPSGRPNGSEVVVGGIDKPGKILSSEYDLIYVNEATDLTVEDWETLGGRLRSAKVPYQQIIADCNPTTPHHWLYKRQKAGTLSMFPTTHQDNPRYWDREKQAWTPLGEQYLSRLGRMTGARKKRFLEGLWVAAEGLVYDGYDAAVHDLPHGWTPPAHWHRVWGIDWGETAPTVLGMWAVDPDGRMHLYREVYRTRLRADKLGEWAKGEIETGREPRPHGTVCDHDEDKKNAFELASGLHLTMADKADRDKGIQDTQARFDVQDDGKPRIYFRPDALAVGDDRLTLPDQGLVDAGHPTCTIEELVEYVWDEDFLKDEPIADKDHGCLVAGTLVATAAGVEPIDRIRPGTMVRTRSGYRTVLCAGCTNPSARVFTVVFSDGRTLTGTADHPVYVATTGFVPLGELGHGDEVITGALSWTSSHFRPPESVRITDPASGAQPLSQFARRSESGTAPCRVLMLIRHDSPAPVFNLTVAGEPEFFANGVLVHNCDQMRYAVRYCDKHFPGPALAAGAGFYATPRPRPPGTDRLTGTAAHIWR